MSRKPQCTREAMLAHACMAFVCSSWALQNVLAKRALVDLHPVSFAVLRDALALPALATAALLIDGAPLWRPRGWRQWASIAGGGAVGCFGIELFYVVGLSLTSSTMASVWSNATPALTITLAFLLRHESFSWLRLAGVLIGGGGLLGTTLWGARSLAAAPHSGTSRRGDVYGDGSALSFTLGNVALLCNTSFFAIYFVMLKPMFAWRPPPPPLTLITWLYLAGTLCTFTFAAVFTLALAVGSDETSVESSLDSAWVQLRLGGLKEPGVVQAILFAALIGGALDYALLTWANPRIGATLQSVWSLVQIPATAAIAWCSLRIAPSLTDSIATGAVVLSIALTSAAHMLDQRSGLVENEVEDTDGSPALVPKESAEAERDEKMGLLKTARSQEEDAARLAYGSVVVMLGTNK